MNIEALLTLELTAICCENTVKNPNPNDVEMK
jgi:hypothetical protein